MSKVKKANKKAVDEMLSSDSSEVVIPKQKKNVKKQADEDDSSSESVNMLKQKRKPSKDLKKPKKQKEPSSDSESEEEQTKKAKTKKPVKKAASDSSSEEVVVSKPKNNKNSKTQKKQDSDDSESEEPVRKPSKASSKKQQKKNKKQDSSESESEGVVVNSNKNSKKHQEEENGDDEEEDNQEIVVVKNNNNNHKNHEHHDGEEHSELFVKNMSYNSNEDSLYEAFSQFGTVTNVKILYDKNTGKSKGIGFIRFECRKEAENAMQNVGEVDGRNIQCAWSNEKPSGDSQGGRNDRNQGRQNQGGFQKVDHDGPVHTIFIGNLGFRTSEKTVASFFADCGRVVDVRIAKGEDGRSRGFCHLDFDSPDAVEKAKSKQNLNLDGREIRVDASEARGNNRGGFGGNRGGNRGGFGGKPAAKQTHPKMGSTGKKVTFD